MRNENEFNDENLNIVVDGEKNEFKKNIPYSLRLKSGGREISIGIEFIIYFLLVIISAIIYVKNDINNLIICFGLVSFNIGVFCSFCLGIKLGMLGGFIYEMFGIFIFWFFRANVIMNNPIISDSGSSIKLFVYFCFLLFILGMILTGVYWFNNKFKENRKILIAVLCCYILSIYLLQFLPSIFSFNF